MPERDPFSEEAFRENMQTFRRRVAEAQRANVCVVCNRPPVYLTEAGRREWLISGTCEICFDRMFGPIEGEEEDDA